MATFVLVHGGWVGGWVWEKLVPRLEGDGNRVIASDLPGHGDDRTPPAEITLDTYVGHVLEAIDAADEPVVLVGHSSGGVIITQTAERRPGRIRHLVYVCAYLPRDGQTLLDLGQTDMGSLLLPNMEFSEDGTTATVRADVVREALFADCTDDDYQRFVARVTPEPLAVAMTPVKVTSENFAGVPKVYIECQRDRAISPELQRRMHGATPCDEVLSLDTGHMPMYAAPETLATQLSALARR